MNVHWHPANIFRLVSILLLIIAILEMAMMMSHYWWRMIPLRREVGNDEIVAPPVIWTFLYHLSVLAMLIVEFVAKTQVVLFERRATFSTWASPVVILGLVISVHFFSKYYSESLNRARHRNRR